MNRIKRLFVIATALALTVVFMSAAVSQAAKVPKVDNFILFVDYSGSMAMNHATLGEKKMVLAKDTMMKMNAGIPELGYKSAMYTFAPFTSLSQPAAYSSAAIDGAIGALDTDYDIFNRLTPMGNGLIDLDSVLAGLDGKTAVIMVTDGASNIGADPVAQAKALYAKYGDKICIHVVSLADTAKGQMIIDQIRAIDGCSVAADVQGLQDDAVMAKFIEDVFFEEKVEDADEIIVFRSLNFGFDKYQITDEMIPALEQALIMLEEKPNQSVEVAGFTDSVGSAEYNQGLSERRANSVKNWLVKNGIDSARIMAKGYGISYKYDNNTAEGRKLNRRVEIRSVK